MSAGKSDYSAVAQDQERSPRQEEEVEEQGLIPGASRYSVGAKAGMLLTCNGRQRRRRSWARTPVQPVPVLSRKMSSSASLCVCAAVSTCVSSFFVHDGRQ